MNNLGILIGRKETDYIAGSPASLPYSIVNPIGDWTKYEPIPENQNSNHADSMACVSYSATHSIETQIQYLTGQDVELSERFLAKMSNTTPQGNYQNIVADTIKKCGMVLETDWPTPVDFSWDSYYQTIPDSVILKGQEFLKKWDIGYEFVNASDVAKHLLQAPLQIVITAENPYHAVELVNQSSYFDSYPPYNKQVGSVHDYFKILVTKKVMTEQEVKNLYRLAFYRLPEQSELDFWKGKSLEAFLETAIKDRANFLSQP